MQDSIVGIAGLSLPEMIFYGALALCALVMVIHYMRSEKPVKTALWGMLTGAAALIAVHFFGGKIGLALPLNGFTSFVAVTLGAPGVALMSIIELIM